MPAAPPPINLPPIPKAHTLLQGTVAGAGFVPGNVGVNGSTFPVRSQIQAQQVGINPRTLALRWLGRYIAELTFFRPGDQGGKPIPFTVPFDNYQVGRPDYDKDMPFPGVAITGQPVEHLYPGFTPWLDESTVDLYGRGTVVQIVNEAREELLMEIWGNKLPELRAIWSGLEVMFAPVEEMFGLRLKMPDYFNTTVCFTLLRSEWQDDEPAVRNRRSAHLYVEMRFCTSKLVNYSILTVNAAVTTADGPPNPNLQFTTR